MKLPTSPSPLDKPGPADFGDTSGEDRTLESAIAWPKVLEDQLADDRNFIENEKRLCPLPRSVTVEKVLKQFFENAKQTSTSRGTVAAREISEGLQHVFNSALGTALLYGFERFQYVELLQAHPDIPLTKLFGAEHLLRLFVMLPNQLMYERVGPDSAHVVGLNQLLKYLAEHFEEFFVAEYDMATPEYMRAQAAFGVD